VGKSGSEALFDYIFTNRPLRLVFLWLVLICSIVLTPQSVRADDKDIKDDRVSTLVDGIVNAYGGEENIDRFYKAPCKFIGACTQHGRMLPLEFVRKGDEYCYADAEGEWGFESGAHWKFNEGLVYRYSKSEDSQQAKQITLTNVLNLFCSSRNILSDFGPGEASNKFDSLRFKPAAWPEFNITVFAEKTTHLVRAISTGDSPSTETITHFDDYRHVSGFWVPFRVSSFQNGRKCSEFVWHEIVCPASEKDLSRAGTHFRILDSDVTVPCKLLNAVLLVNGTVNGKPAEFRVDTGAAKSLLSGAYAKACGIEPDSQKNEDYLTMFSKLQTKHAHLSEISIGNLRLKNLGIRVRKDLAAGESITLGMDILRNYIISIDFVKQTITFSSKMSAPTEPTARTAPLHLLWGPFVDAMINDSASVKFLIDSGNPGVLLVSSEDPLKDLKVSEGKATLLDIKRKKEFAQHVNLRSVVIGGKIRLSNITANLLQPADHTNASSALGLEPFIQFRKLILDFPGERLICLPD